MNLAGITERARRIHGCMTLESNRMKTVTVRRFLRDKAGELRTYRGLTVPGIFCDNCLEAEAFALVHLAESR